MFCKASCSILLLASAALAQQQIMPGTLAPAAAPESDAKASSTPFNPAASSSSDARQPITAQERINWVIKGTVGPAGLAGSLFGAGWDTLFNDPKYYGPHWDGFANRVAMSVTGNAVSNTMEAGLGVIWGEDPRYTRDEGAPFGRRLGRTFKMTFVAQDRDGNLVPAYARYLAIPGSNFLSNAWRVPGDDHAEDALVRTGLGFAGRWGNNVFDEFWPDFKRKLFHHGHSSEEVSAYR